MNNKIKHSDSKSQAAHDLRDRKAQPNSHGCVTIRGARTHNLKNIDLDIPRQELVVITGVSGSGKSSLAFDTLYAEGQRRYVESLSAYARQFLGRPEKPDVDLIEGLSPAISIEQKASSHNPRSTVGTVTEISDYLRLLYARAGTPYCPTHQLPLTSQTVSQMVDSVLALLPETRLMLLAPVARNRKGEFSELFEAMRAHGYLRFRVDGQIYTDDDLPILEKNERHDIDVVVDRLRVRPAMRQRLAESFEAALSIGANNSSGRVIALEMDSQQEHNFSARFACPKCDYTLQELEPRLFSFNSPMGACPECEGLGQLHVFDIAKIVAFPSLSLAAGAIDRWDRRNPYYFGKLKSLAQQYAFDLEETPFEDLPEHIQKIVLYGSGEELIEFGVASESREGMQKKARVDVFEGVVPNIQRRWRETESSIVRDELGKLRTLRMCPSCAGARLKQAALHVRVGEGDQAYPIQDVSQWTLIQAQRWFEKLQLSGSAAQIANRVVREIIARLTFLNNVGLNYLSLHRSADTLSGGELQRIRLASQIGSGLTGVLYVLDEPSIGLHQRDNDRLIDTLKHLRDIGNSVIVVEHDLDMMRAADFIVDIGPGAGVHGGEVVAQGNFSEICATEKSLTGQYLSGALSVPVPARRKSWSQEKTANKITVLDAYGNNLKHVQADFPIGLMTCVTGVSGSGKSTLVNDTLYAAVAQKLYRSQTEPAEHASIEGVDHFDKVINVDQAPIGRTPRSNPATYTGLFTPIRELLAETLIAKERGYGPGRFSFNVAGGRCEACRGDGLVKVEMHFLPDVYVPCDVCHGNRYNRETLEVQWKGLSISDILHLTVEDALELFAEMPSIARKLQTLMDVGLSYIRLGQSATTLSGGEAQRVKLALELSKRETGRTLYILDEPTTGLHFADIAQLIKVLQQLRDAGNTIVVIEHNLDVIKTADWLIDLGPEGGSGGGCIVAQGTPEQVAQNPNSETGRYLKELL